ncbi:MAG: mechanosensitive ion channel family protein, partial [Flavipsychrobacter sp.]|nr:mechanosensitive ion channel family protein [Flavipsychrobacter sp.]
YLHIPADFEQVINGILLVVFTFFVLRFAAAVISEFINSFIKKSDNGHGKEKEARGLVIILNIVIWILGGVFLIDNFGYDVTAIVAGLGIGGIAIALAAQTILGDLFSYFVIFFDRPFEIGDFIIVDDKMGTVEYVGVKTTRIRTLSGEQLVCSNTDLTNSRLHNYKRMEKRRVVFKLEVVYQTSYDKLTRIPGWVRNIIESKNNISYDRGHFAGFGASSLDFEFVYYVSGADYNTYMDEQQSIYLDIVQLFEREQIEFAYPTRTLLVNNTEALPAC